MPEGEKDLTVNEMWSEMWWHLKVQIVPLTKKAAT